MVGLFECCLDCGRGVGHSYQVLSWSISHHFLTVVVELRGGTVGGRDHAQLVGPLESDLGLCGEAEGMAMAASALKEFHRVEC